MFTEKQAHIINSATELIARVGIQKLTIKNLSKEIGQSEGAIYRHFETKRDILLGIIQIFNETNITLFEKIFSDELTAIEFLERLLKARFECFAKKPVMAAVIFSEEIFQDDMRLSQAVKETMDMNIEGIQNIINRGQNDGTIRKDISSKQFAVIIMGALRLTVKRWHINGFSFHLETEGIQLWKSFEKILKA